VTPSEIERRKLSAAYLNTIAAATMVTGVVAPLIATSYELPGPRLGLQAVIASLIWFAVSFVLHSAARRLLKGLDR
jgi:hypothetical protein